MLELNFLPTGLYFIVLPPDHTHRCYKAFPLALDLMLESTEARAIALTFFFFISLRRVTQENLIWQQGIPSGRGKVDLF